MFSGLRPLYSKVPCIQSLFCNRFPTIFDEVRDHVMQLQECAASCRGVRSVSVTRCASGFYSFIHSFAGLPPVVYGYGLYSGTPNTLLYPRGIFINPFPLPGIPSVRPSGPSILAGAVGGAPGTARTHPVVRRDRQSEKVGVLCGLDSRIGQIGLRRAAAMQWPTSCRSGLPHPLTTFRAPTEWGPLLEEGPRWRARNNNVVS